MPHLYSQDAPTFQSGQKLYWGSLYGSAQALALIEYVKAQQQVVLLIANDIGHYNHLYRALNFYNNDLDILRFDNWEVLALTIFHRILTLPPTDLRPYQNCKT